MKTTTSTRRALAAVLVTGLALGGAACGDDDDDDPVAADETTTTAEPDTGDETTTTEGEADPDDDEASAPGTVEVTAEDYAFVGLDPEVPAGTRLTLTNASTAEVHELVAFRLPDGETRSAADLIALGEEGLNALFQGPPATVLVAPPDSAGFPAVGDGSLDEPGRYLLLCAIPTGADPQAYLEAAQAAQGGPVDVPGGPPHLVQGMYADVEVTG